MLPGVVLAVATHALLVHGQCSGTTTITSSAQATALGECATFDGDVVLDPDSATSISINGLSTITGDLSCRSGDQLTDLSADDLVTIGQELSIRSNDLLTSVSFSSLRNIDRLDLYNLPNLTETGWTSALTNVSTVRISQTGFTALGWLRIETAETVTIQDNPSLTNITLPINASEYISFKSNGPTLLVSLPNLQLAYNLSVSNCDVFDVPSLVHINSSAGFIGNAFEKLSMPNIRTIGRTLMLWNNTALSNLNLPVLANVSGNILFHGNPRLQSVDLPDLGIVEGDIVINGSMTSISIPALTDVQGDVYINSTSALDCIELDPYDTSDVFKGLYQCVGSGTASDDASPTADVSSGSGSGSTSLSGGAKGGIAAGAVAGVIGLLSAGYFLWRRRKRARSLPEPTQWNSDKNSQTVSKEQPDENGPSRPAELEASKSTKTKVAELAGAKGRLEASELDTSSKNKSPTAAELSGEQDRAKASELEALRKQAAGTAELPGGHNHSRFELDA